MHAPVRVVIADDHAVVREGVRRVLEREGTLEVVAEAGGGLEALEYVDRTAPDVAVLDISMPGLSGLEITKLLRERGSPVRILILSMHDRPEYVLAAVRAGANGFALKDMSPGELRGAVMEVAGGGDFFPPAVAERLSEAVKSEAASEGRGALLARLTPRERDVLVEIARGRTNQGIAEQLGISRRTVETHRERVMQKLEIRSVAGLTRFVIEAGLDTDQAERDPGAP